MKTNEQHQLTKQIQLLLLLFIISLVLSGLTAFPIETQLTWAHEGIGFLGWHNILTDWLDQVYVAVKQTNAHYPFMAYGTDWLAFAHIVIGIAFIGPLRDPVRNIWVIEFGIISCLAIFPLALIAGSIRGIPIFWQLVDCSFGAIGGTLLGVIWKKTKQLEHLLFLLNKSI